MARGVRRSTEERISEIDAKILRKQKEITKLKEQRKELEDSRKTEIAGKLVQLAEDKGISLEDLLHSVQER